MNTRKLKEALVELQQERDKLDNMISQLRGMIAVADAEVAGWKDSIGVQLKAVRPSYIEETVRILEQAGKPMHVKDITARIAESRKADVPRASVESSLIRHISLGERAKISKFGPSLYGLPSWKGIINNPPSQSLSFSPALIGTPKIAAK